MATNRIFEANLFTPAGQWLGKAKEVVLPEITAMTTDYEGLGSIGKKQYFTGFEAMEGSVTWNSVITDAWRETAVMNSVVPIMVRANMESHDEEGLDSEVPVVYYLNVMFKSLALGSFKSQEQTEHAQNFAVYSIKMEVDGTEEFYLDTSAQIYRVGGVDQIATRNANLGI